MACAVESGVKRDSVIDEGEGDDIVVNVQLVCMHEVGHEGFEHCVGDGVCWELPA